MKDIGKPYHWIFNFQFIKIEITAVLDRKIKKYGECFSKKLMLKSIILMKILKEEPINKESRSYLELRHTLTIYQNQFIGIEISRYRYKIDK